MLDFGSFLFTPAGVGSVAGGFVAAGAVLGLLVVVMSGMARGADQ
jgi:hypothetical protein